MSRALDKADVIYVTGGNTYYLLERSKKSGFLDVVKNKISSGAFYVKNTLLFCISQACTWRADHLSYVSSHARSVGSSTAVPAS